MSQDQGEPRTVGAPGRPVVAFDFDGTITSRDTFRYFLTRIRGKRALAAIFVRRGPQLARGLQGGDARDQAKRVLCLDVLKGIHRRDAEDAAAATADEVRRSLIRTDTAARLRWHQGEGHRVIVVSASFEAYVSLVAASLGVDEVIATRWDVDTDTDILTGGLDGPNVRGPAKVRQIEAYLGHPGRLAYAYGNSEGDAAMLAHAERGVWVGRRPMAELAEPPRD